jgi:hypothetical protein
MSGNDFVAVIAIVAPFLFAGWVISMGVRSKERKRKLKDSHSRESEDFDRELARGIMDLEKRIENLEIILRNRNNNTEGKD